MLPCFVCKIFNPKVTETDLKQHFPLEDSQLQVPNKITIVGSLLRIFALKLHDLSYVCDRSICVIYVKFSGT